MADITAKTASRADFKHQIELLSESLNWPVTTGAKAIEPVLSPDQMREILDCTPGCTVVVSDIHGHYQMIRNLLSKLGLIDSNSNRIAANHKLISIGDVIHAPNPDDYETLDLVGRVFDSVIIGNNVQVSHGVNIIDNNTHSLDAKERHQEYKEIITRGSIQNRGNIKSAPIVIEDDVWISFNASILKGVTIGKGAIIAANSVVTKNVEPYTMVAGNPAIFIKNNIL